MFKINLKTILIGILIAEIASIALAYTSDWEEPTTNPPEGNIATPLTTSTVTQSKEAGLGLGGLLMKGDIDMNGYRIKNVANPTDNSDAATKAYLNNKKLLECEYKSSGWGYQYKYRVTNCDICGKGCCDWGGGNCTCCNTCDVWVRAQASISCTPGYKITGGGCEFKRNFKESYNHYPSGNSFYCYVNGWIKNGWGAWTDREDAVQAQAICCK